MRSGRKTEGIPTAEFPKIKSCGVFYLVLGPQTPSMPTAITQALKDQILVLRHQQGLSVKAISKLLGIHKTLIYKILTYHCVYKMTHNLNTRYLG